MTPSARGPRPAGIRLLPLCLLGLAGCQQAAPPADQSAATPLAPTAESHRQFAASGEQREQYDAIQENQFLEVLSHPKSTFAVDVDTASYSNVRRIVSEGRWPPAGAVRIEEWVNYFPYAYTPPPDDQPLAIRLAMTRCPWRPEHLLLRVGLRGRDMDFAERQAGNLVFLLDVSGSMNDANKLPLVVSAVKMLLRELDARDRIAIVVYAGASGLVLPSTAADRRAEIEAALEQLQAGGSTNGGAGIELAYRVARENFISGGVNRVLLCTDGDFNVGLTNRSDLVELIERESRDGVFLSVFGFGAGNLNDAMMEQLADRGNGNYAYIDSQLEARKALVEQLGGTLATIAQDVKVQLEFNPLRVSAYRLIGYENRLLTERDFEDASRDAGEMGAGHCVTALYELAPADGPSPVPPASPPRFVQRRVAADADPALVVTAAVRYRTPAGEAGEELLAAWEQPPGGSWPEPDEDFRFAAAVAAAGMLLRGSEFAGEATWEDVLQWAEQGRGEDPQGYRAGFAALVRECRELARTRGAAAGD